MRLTAADASTRAAVPLTGAIITYSSNGRPASTESPYEASPPFEPFILCCVTGDVRIQVAAPGYAPLDTTIFIRSRGSCDIPVERNVVVSLRRAPTQAVGRRPVSQEPVRKHDEGKRGIATRAG